MPRVVSVAFAASLFASGVIAGPLAPPPGPVASTDRPLSHLAPRIPIGADTTPGDASAQFVISESGSYYLESGFVVGSFGSDGIRIDASGVTVDLAGFTIDVPDGCGIRVQGSDTTIMNGTITLDDSADGVIGGTNLTLSNVRVIDPFDGALCMLDTGVGAIISDCRFVGGLFAVVGADALIRRTDFSGVQVGLSVGANCVLERVTVGGTNDSTAITAGANCRLTECEASQFSGFEVEGIIVGANSIVERCRVSGFDDGLAVGGASLVVDCVVQQSDFSSITVTGVGTRVRNSYFEDQITLGGARHLVTGNYIESGVISDSSTGSLVGAVQSSLSSAGPHDNFTSP